MNPTDTEVPEEPDEGRASAAKVAALAIDDSFEASVRDIVARGLAAGADSTSAVRKIKEQLARYLSDDDAAIYLLGLLSYRYDTGVGEQLELIEDVASRERLEGIVRRLAGLYGPELEVGMDLLTDSRDNWRTIDVRTLYELESSSWSIKVALTTYGGDVRIIEGPPISIMRLVNYLLYVVRQLADFEESFTDLLDAPAIETFTELAQALLEHLRTPAEDEDAGAEAVLGGSGELSDSGTEVTFQVRVERAHVEVLQAQLASEGAAAESVAAGDAEFLPLVVLLAVVVPPGIGILASVINRIVHSWRDTGTMVDARGDGAPVVTRAPELPHGTVVFVAQDGTSFQRTDLPDDKLSDYIASALKALTTNSSAANTAQTIATAIS